MIMARLREESRKHHEAVESQVGILDHAMTRDTYRRLLRKFWGVYQPLEERLASVTDWTEMVFDINRHRKTPLLEHDLAVLGDPRESLSRLRCPALPPVTNVPQALGCMYVLEGATLGGKVITRHLQRQSGEAYPTAFFDCYGEDVGRMWKAFGEFLSAFSANHGGDDEIVRSACSTFEALSLWLATGEEHL